MGVIDVTPATVQLVKVVLGLALFKIDHPCALELGHHNSDMQKKSDSKDALAVRCPTCGVPAGVRCELSTGSPRITPHRDRRWVAKDRTRQRPIRTMAESEKLAASRLPTNPELVVEGDEAH